MKITLRSVSFLGKGMALLLLTLLIATISNAQNPEVQIMLNGPWSYVQDPDDAGRVVLVAANSANHGPIAVFSGEDATQFQGKVGPLPGKYSLNIPNVACSTPTANKANPYRVADTVDVGLIRSITNDRKGYHPDIRRYTFSLPKPCFYETMVARHSKVDKVLPVTTAEDSYTTWMILHFSVTKVSPAVLQGDSDDGTVTYSDSINFMHSGNSGVPAISFVMPSPLIGSEPTCDSHSRESFSQAITLFGLSLHARFPELDAYNDNQQTSTYSPDCSDSDVGSSNVKMKVAIPTLLQIEQVEGYIDHRIPPANVDANKLLNQIQCALTLFFQGQIPDDVKKELENARKEVDEMRSSMKAGTQSEVGKPRSLRADSSEVLEKTENYIIPFTAGSGDCNSPHLSINGIIN